MSHRRDCPSRSTVEDHAYERFSDYGRDAPNPYRGGDCHEAERHFDQEMVRLDEERTYQRRLERRRQEEEWERQEAERQYQDLQDQAAEKEYWREQEELYWAAMVEENRFDSHAASRWQDDGGASLDTSNDAR